MHYKKGKRKTIGKEEEKENKVKHPHISNEDLLNAQVRMWRK